MDEFDNVLGRQADGVIKSPLATNKSEPSAGAFVDGIEVYGKVGGFDLRKNHISKFTYEVSKRSNDAFGINLKSGKVTSKVVQSNKWLTKQIAGKAPIIGNIMDAYEVYEGLEKDGYTPGKNTLIEASGVVGGTGGAFMGSFIGGAVGTFLIPIPGVGTTVGAVLGGFLGSWGGEASVENLVKNKIEE